jgi:hypothetical protein
MKFRDSLATAINCDGTRRGLRHRNRHNLMSRPLHIIHPTRTDILNNVCKTQLVAAETSLSFFSPIHIASLQRGYSSFQSSVFSKAEPSCPSRASPIPSPPPLTARPHTPSSSLVSYQAMLKSWFGSFFALVDPFPINELLTKPLACQTLEMLYILYLSHRTGNDVRIIFVSRAQ